MFSKTGEDPGDSQKSGIKISLKKVHSFQGIKTGTVQSDPSHITQKPLNTEQATGSTENGAKAARAAGNIMSRV